MIVIGLISWVVGTGLLCWVFFALVSMAVPTMVGLIVFFWTYRMGAGLAAVFFGLVAGIFVLWLFRVALASIQRPDIRLAVVLAFCLPASIAGYSATAGLAQLGNPSPVWQAILGVIGAAMVGTASFARLAPEARQGNGTFLYRHD
ncbi:hypothetical protein [Asaia bogorensis]|uniref:hypothetical protein n=1 Tax=Asaia bogorensis TaxID=91915 RepID=UPI00301A22A4